MDSASDESVNKSRSNGCYKRWIVEHLKERWMAQALDQGEIEGPLDSASDGSVSKSRNDVWYKRWIREQSKERRMAKTLDK
jgi:hypothetical protein